VNRTTRLLFAGHTPISPPTTISIGRISIGPSVVVLPSTGVSIGSTNEGEGVEPSLADDTSEK